MSQGKLFLCKLSGFAVISRIHASQVTVAGNLENLIFIKALA